MLTSKKEMTFSHMIVVWIRMLSNICEVKSVMQIGFGLSWSLLLDMTWTCSFLAK